MKKIYYNILKDICWSYKIRWVYFDPKNLEIKNDFANEFNNEDSSNPNFIKFNIESDFNQAKNRNLYFYVNDFKWRSKEQNLLYIHSFWIDIDIWANKRCKSIEVSDARLTLLFEKYKIKPHYIVKTRNWRHIYFNFMKIKYKDHSEIIKKFFYFLRDFLNWDENYNLIPWLLKVPWSIDYSNWEIFYLDDIKHSSHRKYKIEDIHRVFNEKSDNLDDKKQIGYSKSNFWEYVQYINTSIDAKLALKLLWIVVNWNWNIANDRSISISLNKNWIYYLNDFSDRKHSWLYSYLLNYFWNNKTDLHKFLLDNFLDFRNKFYKINYKALDKKADLKIDKFLFNILKEGFKINFIKLKRDFWYKNEELFLKNMVYIKMKNEIILPIK